MRKLLLLIAALLVVNTQAVLAQSKQIKGTVLDESGMGFPGATVTVKGTSVGTVTDTKGNFQINMPDGSKTLVIKVVGYATESVTAADGMMVQLQPTTKQLNETVVTALGIKREKKTISYATQSVDGEQMNKSGSGNALSELDGQVSGLTVINSAGDPGAGTYIRLRGVTSLTGNNQPLIVIDGIPIDNSINTYDPTNAGFQAGGASGNLRPSGSRRRWRDRNVFMFPSITDRCACGVGRSRCAPDADSPIQLEQDSGLVQGLEA